MPKQDTITFFVDLTLKEEFKLKAKSAGFTMSSALVQLMKRYVEDQRIISTSFDELQERVNQTISKVENELKDKFEHNLSKLSNYVQIIEKQAASLKETTQISLKDEITKIIQTDERVRAARYELVEQAIIKYYNHLSERINESKLNAENIVAEVINDFRDQNLVSYNKAHKRLTWRI